MSDEIVLTLPGERALDDVAHLVVGGLAARVNLTLESLEDLQVALDGLLPRVQGDSRISLGLREQALAVTVGPFGCQALREELDREAENEVGLRRLLSTVSDGFDVFTREGSCWVVLTKNLERAEPG